MTADVAYMTIGELGDAFGRRQVSPLEVTRAMLERIDHLDGQLRSYVTVTADTAMQSARESERRFSSGTSYGPLDGITIGLKDQFDTEGVRTTASSALYKDRIPSADATVVRRLKAAGAVLIGKHAMNEFALVRPLDGEFSPVPRNPWGLDRIPGGSSSGTGVAVAAGLCAGGLGSDTAGSIRLPSSFCGVVGLKPTYGRVSRAGVIPLSSTLDHVGPMTRTVQDASLILTVIAGHDAGDPTSAKSGAPDYPSLLSMDLKAVRLGTVRGMLSQLDHLAPETAMAYEQAIRVLGETGIGVTEVDIGALLRSSASACATILFYEAWRFHQPTAEATPERYGRKFHERMVEAERITGGEYSDALALRADVSAAMRKVMLDVDLIALPTALAPAWSHLTDDESIPLHARMYLTSAFNVTGQPAISVPCGFSAEGLPIGLQLAARPFEEHVALSVAHAYEAAGGWVHRHPRAYQPLDDVDDERRGRDHRDCR